MTRLTYDKIYSVTITRDAKTSRILFEAWRNANGEYERDGDLPARIVYNPATGEPWIWEWWLRGQFHRENGPAHEQLDLRTKTVKVTESWYLHGKLHREGDEPARISRSAVTGKITKLVYSKSGLTHRAVGPAVIRYSVKTGRILNAEYWRHGQLVATPGGNKPRPS